MKARLLATISIVLFVAGIVTMNLNSAVWAKDDYKTDSKDTFKMSEMTNGKVNTNTNDNGNQNFQSGGEGNYQTNRQTNTHGLCDNGKCPNDPKDSKDLGNVMDMLPKPLKPNLP